MQNNNKLRAALLAAVVLCGSGVSCVRADNVFGTAENGWHTVIDSNYDGDVYGNNDHPNLDNVVTGHVDMAVGTTTGDIYGGKADDEIVSQSTVNISGNAIVQAVAEEAEDMIPGMISVTGGNVYGGWSIFGEANNNQVILSGNAQILGAKDEMGEVRNGDVYGGYCTTKLGASYNGVIISGNVKIEGNVRGGYSDYEKASNNKVSIFGNANIGGEVYGGYSGDGVASDNSVIISENTNIEGNVYGGYAEGNASGNIVHLSGGTFLKNIYGGYSEAQGAIGNQIILSDTANVARASIYGGFSRTGGAISDNSLLLDGWSGIVKNLYGFNSLTFQNVDLSKDSLLSISGEVDDTTKNAGITIASIGAGDLQLGELHHTISLDEKLQGTIQIDKALQGEGFSGYRYADREDSGLFVNHYQDVTAKSDGHQLTFTGTVNQSVLTGKFIGENGDVHYRTGDTEESHPLVIGDGFTTKVQTVAGAYAAGERDATGGQVQIVGTPAVDFTDSLYGGYSNLGAATGNTVTVSGDGHSKASATTVVGGYSQYTEASGNKVIISNGTVNTVIGGRIDSRGTASENQVIVTGGTITGSLFGGQSVIDGGTVQKNTVILAGGAVMGSVYGGQGTKGSAVEANTVTLTGTVDVSKAALFGGAGGMSDVSGNTLVVDGWNSSTGSNTVGSVQNFETIAFQNLNWKEGGVALNITGAENAGELANTSVQVDNLVLENGTNVQAGDKMTFIQSNKDTGLSVNKVSVTEDASFSQGVATVGELEMKLEGETNNLVGEIKGVGLNPQTAVIAENRTAAAAFLNQGADIAADSLDLLGSDYKYGLRTFGAVYGNRSTYDAAGDMKLNGWSEIVGLGNVHRKGAGDLSWGVFYENGTGNYRTWNEFNNEMFRGDGSLLYNGGGAAVRYEQDDGWYYEAGVRAGTLSASMENAVKDGNGNSYGFDSDSTYWGVHAGLGRLIETGRGEWNVYSKYFHTDIDGDSFTVGGDRFAFDSLTSDRLRLGARYTADRAKRWSLYCGLAWEYEFSGDSHMKAGQWDAPEQSLGGSTGIAEIGTVWQPDDSPWQANINLKGYAGERDGFSGMVQLAYTF